MAFKKGQSGNPAGRKPGTGKAQQLRRLLEPHAEKLIEKAVSMALGGDGLALKLCLERLVPVLKPAEPPVSLKSLTTGALGEQGTAVLAAAGKGELTADQAAKLMQGLAAQAKIIETAELEERIRTLETRSGNQAPYQAA